MGARMQQQLDSQLRMIEASGRQLEERHRDESARLEREIRAKVWHTVQVEPGLTALGFSACKVNPG